jgi:hypothetical protein
MFVDGLVDEWWMGGGYWHFESVNIDWVGLLPVVLQGPVCRTGIGPRTGPDCNRFEWTNGSGHYNLFEKDRKRPRS